MHSGLVANADHSESLLDSETLYLVYISSATQELNGLKSQ